LFKRASSYLADSEPELLAGLDIGTSKTTVVVAERGRDGAEIIAVGQAPSSGIRKGLIVNLDQVVRSVKNAVSDAQNLVGQDLTDVTVAFGGGEVTSILSKGMVSLGRSPRQVMSLDIERAIEFAQADISVPSSQTILHTIPVEYSLDGNAGIDDPLEMTGMRLDIQLQSIIVPTATIQNVLNCVEKAGLSVSGLVIKPIAAALGALTPEEASSGAAVVDIGGGTTGLAVFHNGRPKFVSLISIGGDHITNDVGSVLKIPINKAEEIKKEVSVFNPPESEDEEVTFDYSGRSYSVPKADLHDIVRCRVEELFDVLVKPKIKSAGVPMLPGGIVLTGGVSKMEGIDSLLYSMTDLSVRVATPLDASKMPPSRNTQEYTAASGIIKYMTEKERDPFRYLEPQLTMGGGTREKRSLLTPKSDTSKGDDKKQRSGSNFLEGIGKVLRDLF
jgi:cell division protein FtsA